MSLGLLPEVKISLLRKKYESWRSFQLQTDLKSQSLHLVVQNIFK